MNRYIYLYDEDCCIYFDKTLETFFVNIGEYDAEIPCDIIDKIYKFNQQRGAIFMLFDDQIEKFAEERWNSSCDKYNQWDSLGKDEKRALINDFKENLCSLGRLNSDNTENPDVKTPTFNQQRGNIMFDQDEISALIQIVNDVQIKGQNARVVANILSKLEIMGRRILNDSMSKGQSDHIKSGNVD